MGDRFVPVAVNAIIIKPEIVQAQGRAAYSDAVFTGCTGLDPERLLLREIDGTSHLDVDLGIC